MQPAFTPAKHPKLGRAMVVFGLVVIVASVIYVLEAANGPGTGPKSFAQRRSYNQVKESVHATYPLAFLFALSGLGITMAGSRLLRGSDPNATLPPQNETGDHV